MSSSAGTAWRGGCEDATLRDAHDPDRFAHDPAFLRHLSRGLFSTPPTTDTVDGTSSTGHESTSTTAIGDTTGSGPELTTSSSSEDTNGEDCLGDQDCVDPDAAFCVGGSCAGCDETPTPDEACASRDADKPLCEQGQCVQCTVDDATACGGDTPVCDTQARTCVGCTYHFQCPDSACHIAEGSCMPTDRVWTVGNAAEVIEALEQIGSGEKGTILLEDSNCVRQMSLTITGARIVALIALGEARIAGTIDGDPPFDVANATLYLQGLQIAASSADEAIMANGARLWIDQCRFGIVSSGVSGSAQNARTSITLTAASELTLRNSFVGGISEPDHSGVDVGGGSHATILYSTIGAGEPNVALSCSDPGEVIVRNSILATQGSSAHDCPAAAIDTTAVRTMADTGWFQIYGASVFFLTESGEDQFANVAVWLDGDPPFDFEGNPRPTTDGAPDFAGGHSP